jgi:hypothetical protein
MTVKDRVREFVKFKGITMSQFERMCGLSVGYVNAMRVSFGKDYLNNVLKQFPELNREWLLYGEGEMLKSGNFSQNQKKVTQNNENGDNIQGQNVTVQSNPQTNVDEFLAIIKQQANQITKSQEQIDRLISIIEKR